MSGHQAVRIGVSVVGVGLQSWLYSLMRNAAMVARPEAAYLYAASLVVTFAIGLVIELVPLRRRLAPSWSGLAVPVVCVGLLFVLANPVGPAIFGLNPVTKMLVQNTWMPPTLSLLLGVLVAKALSNTT